VHVEDGFARTTIDQTYFNHDSNRLEGTLYFPLPPDASLSRLAMYVGEYLMEGGMAERERARNVYLLKLSSF
jgi:Ca-activated chloride channel family protein